MTRSPISHLRRLVLLPLAALGLSASMAQADFRGGGVLFGFTETCAQNGWQVGTSYPVRTRYSASEDVSAPPSELTIAFPTGTEHVTLWGGFTPSTSFFGAAGRQSWMQFAFYATRPLVRVVQRQIHTLVNNSQPSTVQNAREVTLRLRIQNFNNLPGCAVTVVANMRRV